MILTLNNGKHIPRITSKPLVHSVLDEPAIGLIGEKEVLQCPPRRSGLVAPDARGRKSKGEKHWPQIYLSQQWHCSPHLQQPMQMLDI